MNEIAHRRSCMSFQSLILGWLALILVLEEYQEHLLLPFSPLAQMPGKAMQTKTHTQKDPRDVTISITLRSEASWL